MQAFHNQNEEKMRKKYNPMCMGPQKIWNSSIADPFTRTEAFEEVRQDWIQPLQIELTPIRQRTSSRKSHLFES